MDFYTIACKKVKNDDQGFICQHYPVFRVGRSNDIMVRGKSFYAIWDEEAGLWSTDEYDVQRLVDRDLYKSAINHASTCIVKDLGSYNNSVWKQFKQFMKDLDDNHHPLDQNITFSNTIVKKNDYVSKRLPYPIEEKPCPAWDELVGTLYSIENRAKIEWAIGSIIAGDSKKLQKFLVLYGSMGSGKSTILRVIEQLFSGYITMFDAKALTSVNNSFSTESFKHNPLVAIQHDGDLSNISDNTKLNSIVSHEKMSVNEKYKSAYDMTVLAFLFMGTNKPVKISDAKSGIIRRLIDVKPSGVRIPENHYNTLLMKIEFELGAIAARCLNVYQTMGKHYYSNYRPVEMMLQTDPFYNYIEHYFDVFKSQNGVALKQAWVLYKEFCSDGNIDRPLQMYKFREELRNYFEEFHDRIVINDEEYRSYFLDFNMNKFKIPTKEKNIYSLVIDQQESLLDEALGGCAAQYAKIAKNGSEIPKLYWSDKERLVRGRNITPKPNQIVSTTLEELDPTQVHFLKPPERHIVIDFDLKDLNGTKSLERNLEAASNWPATYAELSKSGSGVHLHYIYDGDTTLLSNVFSEGIEVKTFHGDASLRRRLTLCNNVHISTINSGLPLKEKKMINEKVIQTEKSLRDLILRNLRKEIHPSTKSSIDFIHKILEDAYISGAIYDVTDMRNRIFAFANNSTNRAIECLKVVQTMKWKSEEDLGTITGTHLLQGTKELLENIQNDEPIVFFDVEVYPNLFVICWKYRGSDNVVRMVNPTAQEVEAIFKFKLVGFYCRRYDNHILYARYMGYSNKDLFELSQRIIVHDSKDALFGEAYELSYCDIWDVSSKKQGLKLFEIELGIFHMELDLPWDEPVPEDKWNRVIDYCVNDVVATEAVFEARYADFVARQILAELSGLSMNSTTQQHTAKIVFEGDRRPQTCFVYTDLSKEFPGYVFDKAKSYYKGELVGEGGYVYSEPGMHENVAVLDVASMHPTSIIKLNMFGKYTKNFADILHARLAIKHKDYDLARTMLDGKLAPYLNDPEQADALAYALKIAINIVYGLTSASFDNAFKDRRNIDNIAAKRGALFMIDLVEEVQAQGFQVVHIKTDSIKIPNATTEIIEFVSAFGEKYGYDFEYDGTYERFCLVNDAVYVARKGPKWNSLEEAKKKDEVKGAQFAHPYVYKTLFSHEPITFDDYCETKNVKQGKMYLDFEHDRAMALVEDMHFVGKTGRFVPVIEGVEGGILWRYKDEKLYAVTGTKGYLWMEAEIAKQAVEAPWDLIDMSYFERLANEARKTVEKFGDFEQFADCE